MSSIRSKKSATKAFERSLGLVGRYVGILKQSQDTVFDKVVSNYEFQISEANKVYVCLREYHNCAQNIHNAHRNLQNAVCEAYDKDWVYCDQVRRAMGDGSLLYEELLGCIESRISDPLAQYISRFPAYKEKIDKRQRKLISYDMKKYELESQIARIQKAKEPNDPKLLQKLNTSETDFNNAKLEFDKITDELYEDLPNLYNSRALFYAKTFESLFQAMEKFHEGMLETSKELTDCLKELKREATEHTYDVKTERPSMSEPEMSEVERYRNLSNELPLDATSLSLQPIEEGKLSHLQQFNEGNVRNRSSTIEKAANILTNSKWKKNSRDKNVHTPDHDSVSMELNFRGSQEFYFDDQSDLTISNLSASQNGNLFLSLPVHESTLLPEQNLLEKKDSTMSYESADMEYSVIDNNMVIVPTATSSIITLSPHSTLSNPTDSNSNCSSPLPPTTQCEVKSKLTIPKKPPRPLTLFDPPDIIEPPAKISAPGLLSPSKSFNIDDVDLQVQMDLELLKQSKRTRTDSIAEPRIMYRVIANFSFIANNTDELSFETNDTISVSFCDNLTEIDDGWLMGIHEDTHDKGFFPANHTTLI